MFKYKEGALEMHKRELDCIKDILSKPEYQVVTKLIEEVNNKNLQQDSVGFYVQEIKKTLNIISHRKNMMTCALNALERYIESGEKISFEKSIKGSRLLDTENTLS